MTVKDLRKFLEDLPDEMPVICTRYSGFQDQDYPSVTQVLKYTGKSDWDKWERYYPSHFHDGLPPQIEVVSVLHFEGN